MRVKYAYGDESTDQVCAYSCGVDSCGELSSHLHLL